MPRKRGDTSTEICIAEADECWRAATAANGDVPPMSQAHDNASNQVGFSFLFLGLRAEDLWNTPSR